VGLSFPFSIERMVEDKWSVRILLGHGQVVGPRRWGMTWLPLPDPRHLGLEWSTSPKLLGCGKNINSSPLGLVASPDLRF